MSILSIYIGDTEISFVASRNNSDVIDESNFFKFPYVYAQSLQGSSYSEEKFFKDLINLATKSLGIKLDDCKLRVVTNSEITPLALDVSEYFVFYNKIPANHYYVTPLRLSYAQTTTSVANMEPIEDKNMNANREIFNFQDYQDVIKNNQTDQNINYMFYQAQAMFKQGVVNFFGDRMSYINIAPHLTSLLIINSISQVGKYVLRIDEHNIFPHFLHSQEMGYSFTNLGTLLNSPGYTEVLVKTSLGTSQLLEILPQKLFILPLKSGDKADILVKSNNATQESVVSGGDVGLIIDTRDKSLPLKFTNEDLQVVERARGEFF